MIQTGYTPKRRSRLLYVPFCGFFLVIAKLFYLQVYNHEHYAAEADKQQMVSYELPAERGAILDRQGRELSASMQGQSLWVDPKFIPAAAVEPLANRLSGILEMQVEDLQHLLTPSGKRFVWIKRHLNSAEVEALAPLVKETAGIYFRQEWMRNYSSGPMLTSLVGVVGTDHTGLTGIEAQYDNLLHGRGGNRTVCRDASRKKREIFVQEEVQPRSGHSIQLTIDLSIQTFLYTELLKGYQECKPKIASGIVVDVASGEILAVLSLPSHHPQDSIPRDLQGLVPRALVDTFEPGSTMKPLIYAGMLQAGKGRAGEIVFCGNGSQRFGARVLHDVHGYGNLSFEDVIVKSSNIGAAYMGLRLGDKQLYALMHNLGFGQRCFLPVRGEPAGTLHPLKRWSGLTITSLPMGHEVSVTMMQMVMAYAAIGNGGYLLQPVLEKCVYTPSGEVLRSNRSIGLKKVFTPDTCSQVLSTLEKVVLNGTATKAVSPYYRIAGKTGTTEKLVGGRYVKNKNIGSFICLAPASDPRIAVMILMDEPSTASFGGVVAAPVARKVIESTLFYLGVEPDQKKKEAI